MVHKRHRHKTFTNLYSDNPTNAAGYLAGLYQLDTGHQIDLDELEHRMGRYGLNPCGEALLNDNHCNLGTVHLANVDPEDLHAQEEAFQAASWQAVALLERNFLEERFRRAREYDPILIVSWTEGFDFFTRLFEIDWVRWWAAGRPSEWQPEGKCRDSHVNYGSYYKTKEKEFLTRWRDIVHQTVWDYCLSNGLKRPNRCTGIKPEGSLTLLTGAGCNGLHPPKSWRYIRRKSYPKNDPIALAKIQQGYSVVPGQSDLDADGNLLNDPFSPLCTEWLLEVPVEERLIRLYPELENYPPSQFSAAAQFDWFMQVQQHYSTHNISCTLEVRKEECRQVARLIYDAIRNDAGYISMAMLRRYDEGETFPRYPFEPISKERYQHLHQNILMTQYSSESDFFTLVNQNLGGVENTPQDAACDSAGCGF